MDIGRLSAAVLAGYPGTIAGAWQQAGRAGRHGVGLAAALFDLHAELLTAAKEAAATCGCEGGCPSCIGPGEPDSQTRLNTQRLLQVIAA